ncbi:hypothetical protein E3E38_09470 [Thermococcus sp. 18S1]|uniref:hypothetical protein n=1 Tax=Thermococcus sp. 18S1 TaxID=1638210 RepID=UPI00143A5CB3|nr:hypothetical protein [Thermococcus sp. 18S1]NJE31268.1 hypothetical protein [Thermococcus sp. 18S1]
MRRALKTAVLVVLVLLELPLTAATPYWAKPGVYMEYASLRNEEIARQYAARNMTISTADITIDLNGTYAVISAYGDTFLTFNITSETREYLVVRMTLRAFNVTLKEFGPKIVRIWRDSAVINQTKLENETVFTLSRIDYSCTYRIRKSDNAVFDTEGVNYGHTFLWDDLGNDPIAVGEPFQLIGFSGNSVSKVVNVTDLDLSVVTSTANFSKPIVYVRTGGGGAIKTPVGEVSFSGTDAVMYFDGSSGMFVTGFFPTTPDLAACGIKMVYFMDQWGMYMSRNHKKEGVLYTYGIGFYDTNADFGEVETLEYSGQESSAGYVFYGIVGIVAVTLLALFLKRRR